MREFIISASDNLVKKIVKDKTNDLTHLFYVYYKKGHAKYLIVSRDIAKSGFYFLVLLWLALGLTGLNIDLFQDLFGKQRLADSSYCSEIYDNPDYFSAEEEKALRRIFCDIQKKTGISVVLENFTYQEWVFFRYLDLSDWIHKRYDALFSDEDHWLLVLSAGNPDNDSKWFIREIHGDNTEDVLTPYVIEKFTSELQDKLNYASESEDYSIGNVVCASFYEFYKRELSGGPVDIGAAAFLVFVLILAITLYGILLFFLYINLKYIFVKYIFKTRLFQIGYTLFKKETICPVCCGSYVINIHSECPHCGVKIKRAPYGTSCHSDKNINASSPVFDNIGSYGGDQLDIYRQAGRYFFDWVFSYNKELFETARSYPKFKDYTNREISDLFRSISIEGCGYVAVVNAIFVHFKNDNKRFEKRLDFQ